MLQAKVLDYNGKYKDIEHWAPDAQYRKLITWASAVAATPYYLLYNGYTINSGTGSDDLGLSCVHARRIERLRHQQSRMAVIPHGMSILTFDMLFRENMFPFYYLFCRTPSRFFHSIRMELDGTDIYRGYPYIRVDGSEEPPTDDGGAKPSSDVNDSGIYSRYRILVPFDKNSNLNS
ncbi:MAG: hypothetical protein EOP56_10335 [Sphingobacteriales bacterium]|nr:MAG: hypothetical protein EOP56_10335 [Sphingobacteriales bacterium]